MRGLKALVIGMGVVIVAGLVVLVVAIADRAGELGVPAPVDARVAPLAPAPPQTLALPRGAEVVETRIGDGRIVLRLRLASGAGRLVVLDAATGRTTATVDLVRE